MTPHEKHHAPSSAAGATTFDRRGTSRAEDDAEGAAQRKRSAWLAALYASRIARALVVVTTAGGMLAMGLSSLGFLSSTPSSRISALSTVVAGDSKNIDHNAKRIDSLGHVVDVRFEGLDDRLTFMSYLLCTQSAAHLAPTARTQCDTIIQRRLSP